MDCLGNRFCQYLAPFWKLELKGEQEFFEEHVILSKKIRVPNCPYCRSPPKKLAVLIKGSITYYHPLRRPLFPEGVGGIGWDEKTVSQFLRSQKWVPGLWTQDQVATEVLFLFAVLVLLQAVKFIF